MADGLIRRPTSVLDDPDSTRPPAPPPTPPVVDPVKVASASGTRARASVFASPDTGTPAGAVVNEPAREFTTPQPTTGGRVFNGRQYDPGETVPPGALDIAPGYKAPSVGVLDTNKVGEAPAESANAIAARTFNAMVALNGGGAVAGRTGEVQGPPRPWGDGFDSADAREAYDKSNPIGSYRFDGKTYANKQELLNGGVLPVSAFDTPGQRDAYISAAMGNPWRDAAASLLRKDGGGVQRSTMDTIMENFRGLMNSGSAPMRGNGGVFTSSDNDGSGSLTAGLPTFTIPGGNGQRFVSPVAIEARAKAQDRAAAEAGSDRRELMGLYGRFGERAMSEEGLNNRLDRTEQGEWGRANLREQGDDRRALWGHQAERDKQGNELNWRREDRAAQGRDEYLVQQLRNAGAYDVQKLQEQGNLNPRTVMKLYADIRADAQRFGLPIPSVEDVASWSPDMARAFEIDYNELMKRRQSGGPGVGTESVDDRRKRLGL